MLSSAEKDVFTFISPGLGRSLVWLHCFMHGHDRSSFHSLLLVSFHISNVILHLCMRAHVVCTCCTQSNAAGDLVPRVGLQTANAEDQNLLH